MEVDSLPDLTAKYTVDDVLNSGYRIVPRGVYRKHSTLITRTVRISELSFIRTI